MSPAYLLLNLPFLAVVLLVALAAVLARRAPAWRSIGLAAIVLVVLTAVFDNVLVGTGIVGYDETLISGIRVGVAPIEDFAYALAALVLLPSLWQLLPAPPERAVSVAEAFGGRGLGSRAGDDGELDGLTDIAADTAPVPIVRPDRDPGEHAGDAEGDARDAGGDRAGGAA